MKNKETKEITEIVDELVEEFLHESVYFIERSDSNIDEKKRKESELAHFKKIQSLLCNNIDSSNLYRLFDKLERKANQKINEHIAIAQILNREELEKIKTNIPNKNIPDEYYEGTKVYKLSTQNTHNAKSKSKIKDEKLQWIKDIWLEDHSKLETERTYSSKKHFANVFRERILKSLDLKPVNKSGKENMPPDSIVKWLGK